MCTNLTLSRIHILHVCPLPTKVLMSFVRVALCPQYPSGVWILHRSWSSNLCFRVTSRHLRPFEGELLHSSQVLAIKLVLPSDHSSPSATRRWAPSFIAGLGRRQLSFGHPCSPIPGPCRQVRRCFRVWD